MCVCVCACVCMCLSDKQVTYTSTCATGSHTRTAGADVAVIITNSDVCFALDYYYTRSCNQNGGCGRRRQGAEAFSSSPRPGRPRACHADVSRGCTTSSTSRLLVQLPTIAAHSSTRSSPGTLALAPPFVSHSSISSCTGFCKCRGARFRNDGV
jgi:hypothetical protein